MMPKKLTSDLSVAPQISVADVADLAAQGFKSIICNRPDGERTDQPPYADIERAALATGLSVRHIPVRPGQISDADVAEFRVALDELPKPVLAYCQGGGRSTALWTLSQAERMPSEEIAATARPAGSDMSGGATGWRRLFCWTKGG